ncbi:membrane-anchored junction protein-like isoform X2 [Hirundo rustica]|uniref:membrane-anchored junction protein-like isoform X2 n=1 Tax=Hirundo rustica TaxID=43150 RepID=UPI001A93E1CF|nr:membrane-anchored junction protein-like isoform X2 [Hirundo rustica]XP_039932627.1 membrane-anchored junction protein-like isoform X2 [Hirundo rustica]XP_039932628.1 membrane-anchored junction protein-like isoform X2 [Hirundo rustica]XP_039932629.1 membrane-anchored junction protein-like isoform X2 [Hirundo rustica]
MSLKPFTYPLPETRFLHAGRHVYKFKIRYGNLNSSPSLSLTEGAAKESEEVIRVILGNLDDLHPFSTDHFTVFPYLSKWERVSKMKFKHENVHLVPYPYMCTLYLELNSFQQNVSCGKEVKKGSDERNSSKANELEFCAASLTKDCDQLSFWEPVEFALEQKRAVSQAEGAVQLLQQMDQTGKKGDMKSGGGGLSQFWRSIIFSPLQHLFGGKK